MMSRENSVCIAHLAKAKALTCALLPSGLAQIDLTSMVDIENAERPLESMQEILQELEWV